MLLHVLPFLILTWSIPTLGALPPQTDLHIVNEEIAPDGFKRLAVLAEGMFPAPLIVANKASKSSSPILPHSTC